MMASQTGGSRTRLRPGLDTKVSELLKAYPGMIEVLARFNKHFELLRRPALRKLMTPLVTIGKAARTAQVDPWEMLAEIYRAIGEPVPPEWGKPRPVTAAPTVPMPDELRSLPDDRRLILDVRDQVRAGEEPYHRIMQAVGAIKGNQVLQLCNLFEPVPLYDVLEQRGFAHWTERRGPEEWWVTFYRPVRRLESASSSSTSQAAPAAGEAPLVVDARGLEPPQPMARILEALPRIETGGQLLAMTDRRPMLLYPKLEDRGFKYVTEETANGWFETRIWK
jgi:uncharacterized protein (DUF2249 family)